MKQTHAATIFPAMQLRDGLKSANLRILDDLLNMPESDHIFPSFSTPRTIIVAFCSSLAAKRFQLGSVASAPWWKRQDLPIGLASRGSRGSRGRDDESLWPTAEFHSLFAKMQFPDFSSRGFAVQRFRESQFFGDHF